MTFINFLLFCFASVGMTFILVDGSIFFSLREFFRSRVVKIELKRERGKEIGWNIWEFIYTLITCHQCCGFWCGVFCALFLFEPYVSKDAPIRSLFYLFAGGCTASILSILFFRVFDICHAVAGYYHTNTIVPEQEQIQHNYDEPITESQTVDKPMGVNRI
ncbi:MAG: DUF1360 domain-containing protein [Planctomycetaceae bacterium]|jgi:hypothetical protein|nr:DUF1360 domain-containing protein [Planctomycetaceae bacterium]